MDTIVPNTASYILCDMMSHVTNEQILTGISKNVLKLPDIPTFLDLANNPNNDLEDKRIGYDMYIKHNKYSKHDKIKYDNIEYDYISYAKVQYINTCSWLIDLIEKMISEMINNNTNTIIKNIDTHMLSYLGLTTKNTNNVHEEKNPCHELMQTWTDMEYVLPSEFIKNNVGERGYDVKYIHKNKIYYVELSLIEERAQKKAKKE